MRNSECGIFFFLFWLNEFFLFIIDVYFNPFGGTELHDWFYYSGMRNAELEWVKIQPIRNGIRCDVDYSWLWTTVRHIMLFRNPELKICCSIPPRQMRNRKGMDVHSLMETENGLVIPEWSRIRKSSKGNLTESGRIRTELCGGSPSIVEDLRESGWISGRLTEASAYFGIFLGSFPILRYFQGFLMDLWWILDGSLMDSMGIPVGYFWDLYGSVGLLSV